MMKVRIHYAVSTLTQAAAEVVLDHPNEVQTYIKAVRQRREKLTAHLLKLGADISPSATNFVCLRLPRPELAAQIHHALLEEGKLISCSADPALEHILRITTLADALVPGLLATLERSLTWVLYLTLPLPIHLPRCGRGRVSAVP